MQKKVHIPAGEPAGRIVCPQCGNGRHFVEIAENVQVTTRYQQNSDGSFTLEDNSSELIGEVRFLCWQCGADMSQFHTHFLEMTF